MSILDPWNTEMMKTALKILIVAATLSLTASAFADDTLTGALTQAQTSLQQARARAQKTDPDTRDDIYHTDAEYPRQPMRTLTFLGFGDAKTDNDSYEEKLCQRQTAELALDVQKAAGAIGVESSHFSVEEAPQTHTDTRCYGPTRRRPTKLCINTTISLCGATLTSHDQAWGFRYQRLPDQDGVEASACAARLEKWRSAHPETPIVESNVISWRHRSLFKRFPGCAVQMLQLAPMSDSANTVRP